MKEYTIEQCKADMIELWGELARTGGGSKDLACNSKFTNYLFNCPCCEFAKPMSKKYSNCIKCPIKDWGIKHNNHFFPCDKGYAFYWHWRTSETALERKYWANKILIQSHMIRCK